MRQLRKKISKEKALYFPERIIEGVTCALECEIKNISYGISPLLNSLDTQDSHMIELINKACDHDRNNLTTDPVLELADLISRIRKHYKGGSFRVTRTKFRTIRELAIRQCIDAIVIQSRNNMAADDQNISKLFQSLSLALARVFIVSYLLQSSDDIYYYFGFQTPEGLIEEAFAFRSEELRLKKYMSKIGSTKKRKDNIV
jgi:hypothetical protein